MTTNGEAGVGYLLRPGYRLTPLMFDPEELVALSLGSRMVRSWADAARSERIIQPLGLVFWGETWTLGAWCELRGDFRSFRLDRIAEATPLADTFDSTGMLARYLQAVKDESCEDAA